MAITKIGELELDELIASGRSPLYTKAVTIKGSGTLKRGQLVGTAMADSDEYEATSDGGMAEAYGILCEDVEATSNGVGATIYVSGHFNANKVIGYSGGTSLYNTLRDKGIYIESAIAY